jgi:hypothetical protein
MKDALGHGSNAHNSGVEKVGKVPMNIMYHGSNVDFNSFELGHGGGGSKNGVWLADEPGVARDYAGIMARYGGSPTMYHATVGGNMATEKQWQALEKSIPGTSYTFERDKKIVDTLKSQGYDGVRFGKTVYMLNPEKIKIVKKEPL